MPCAIKVHTKWTWMFFQYILTFSGILQKSCTRLLSYRTTMNYYWLLPAIYYRSAYGMKRWSFCLTNIVCNFHDLFVFFHNDSPGWFTRHLQVNVPCKALLIWLLSWFEFYFGFHLKSVEENTSSNVVKHQKYILKKYPFEYQACWLVQ